MIKRRRPLPQVEDFEIENVFLKENSKRRRVESFDQNLQNNHDCLF